MTIDPRGRRNPYEQVADILRARILSGELAPDTQIPSEPDLQAEFVVARGTVRKAIGRLKAEGLLVTTMGRGTFVTLEEERPS